MTQDHFRWHSVEELMAIANPIAPEERHAEWVRMLANAAPQIKILESPHLTCAVNVYQPNRALGSLANLASAPFQIQDSWVSRMLPTPRKWWQFWR